MTFPCRTRSEASAASQEWGGHRGSFAAPDGYIWSISYRAQGKDSALRGAAVAEGTASW